MKINIFLVILFLFLCSCSTENKQVENNTSNYNFNELVESNMVFNTIYERRSIREFKDQDVEDDMIKLLVEAAQWAPSSVNVQSWRFIAVRDSASRYAIARKVHERYNEKKENKVSFENLEKYLGLQAPVQIFVFNDTRNSRDPYDDAIGCFAAMQNFILAAKSLGLGTCWQSFPVIAKDVVGEILEVPEDFELVSTIALGYADEQPKRKERKYQIDEILSFEKWD